MTLREPLCFAPQCLEKVWGGRGLEPYFPTAFPPAGPVGEVWVLVDRDDRSSVVRATGAFEGRSLRGLMLSEARDLLGRTRPGAGGHFPLLVKYLDAARDLSVQVHPDARTAERLGGGASGKTECWYVLSADPGSRIYLGLEPDVEPAHFAASAGSAAVVGLLRSYPVHPGQFVFVPPGTVHAIGAGLRLIEVQENSDTTYRLYDWSRRGLDGAARPLHLDEGLRSIDYGLELEGPIDPVFRPDAGGDGSRARVVDCEAFGVELQRVGEPELRTTGDRALLYVVVEGRGTLGVAGLEAEWPLRPGETWLVPAAVGEHRVESTSKDLRLLVVETRE